jgi:hypothetical protein
MYRVEDTKNNMVTQLVKLSISHPKYYGHLNKPPTCNATSPPQDAGRPISDAVGVRTSAPDLTRFNTANLR